MAQGISTLVALHDLLGYGGAVAASGGTLDSAMGEIALGRLELLSKNLATVAADFPECTKLFHFNDMVVACLDIDYRYKISPIESRVFVGQGVPSPTDRDRLFGFLRASAKLHRCTSLKEAEERCGPGGRTVVSLGERWEVGESGAVKVKTIPELQANLAFAEAHFVDSLGSNGGFSRGPLYNFFASELVTNMLSTCAHGLGSKEKKRLDAIGGEGIRFPENLFDTEPRRLVARIFHRNRAYFSLKSSDVCNL